MRLLARGLALLIMVLPGVTLSLGLGELEINTALNQPLEAQIKLHSVRQDELEDMRVSVASETAFERAGIDRPSVLNQLRFTPRINSAGQTVIEVTTKGPVREPFLNFLLEVQWPKGRLLREYTVLLDPPVMFEQADTVGVQPPVSDAYSSTTPSIINQPSRTAGNESRNRPYSGRDTEQAITSSSPKAGSQTFTTKSGDTLSEIAAELRPDEGTSLPQMMIALLRANPESFIRGNINELMAGVIMRVPTQAELATVDRAWASAEVLQQNTLWRQYRSKLTANVPSRPSGELGPPQQSSAQGGRIEGSPRDQQIAEQATDGKLEILPENESEVSKAGGLANDAEISSLREEAMRARELAASRSVENAELTSKIQQLEEVLAQQESLLKIQSEELATLQNSLAAVEKGAESIVAEVTDKASVTGQGPESEGLEIDTGKETVDAGISSPSDQNVTSLDESKVGIADSDTDAAPIDSNVLEASTSETQETTPVQSEPATDNNETEIAPVEATVSDSTVQSETRETPTAAEITVDSNAQTEVPETLTLTEKAINLITTNTLVLAAIAGTVLLLAVLSWLLVSRYRAGKKTDQAEQPVDSISSIEATAEQEAGTASQELAEAADSTSESSSDTAADADQQPPMSQPPEISGESEKRSESDRPAAGEYQDDTLTEADVYIAYNLHQQAEDLLKEAIAKDPERDDYRIKLLENYCAAGNRESFDVVAEELCARLGGAGEQWERVLALAGKISPDHPLLTDSVGGESSVFPAQIHPPAFDDVSQPGNAQGSQTDMVGDMGSGYLSELTSGQDQALSDDISSSDEVSGDAIEFDVSELDLSFDEDSLEVPAAGEVSEGDMSDSNLMDFELSDLDLDIGPDGEDEALLQLEADDQPDEVELLSSDVDNFQSQDDALEGAIADSDAMFEGAGSPHSNPQGLSEAPLDAMQADIAFSAEDSDTFSVDSDLQEPIDGTDIDNSDIEFEQSTSALDLDAEVSIDELSEGSTADEGSFVHLDEVETEILKPLNDEPSFSGALEEVMDEGMSASPKVSKTESGLADFSSLDLDTDSGGLDQQEDALSLDEMASDWGADGQDSSLQAAADEDSEISPEAGLDAALEPEAVDTVSEIGSETNVELSQDPSTSFEQDIAQGETENLADLDAFLTEIPGNQPPSEQAPSSDLDGMEGAQPVVESEGAFADEDGGEFEEFDVLDEINTKLDLARAYIDMGDPENARSALEEVLHQGDGEQRKEAEDLIKQIA